MTSPDVLIVGGGIAGIAAALRLAEQNVRVTLLETRRKLGGRATSFVDVRTGQMLDNCQHVTLGCCVNYLDFLGRLGALDLLEWHDEQYWIERGGRTSIIRPGWLPAPLHFTGAMLGASFLSLGDIAQLARIGGAMLRTDRTRHTGETFGAYLRGHGQSERLIRRFWSPVVVSACNLDVDKVAASSALHVFQDGFFAHAKAASIGLSRVPLVQLYDRAESAIAAAGGTIRLSCGVDRIGPASVVTSAGETLRAGAVICALPVERAREVIDPASRDDRHVLMERFEFSPILGVHLAFDRPVISTPHAVLVDAPTQWLFRKDAAGHHVHAVISAADEWMGLSETEIASRVCADIKAYLPGSAPATLLSARPVKEKRATFAPTPLVEQSRPSAIGNSGLILAGDYTATGWPATMEGAARSGYSAAAAVLGAPLDSLHAPALHASRLVRLARGA